MLATNSHGPTFLPLASRLTLISPFTLHRERNELVSVSETNERDDWNECVPYEGPPLPLCPLRSCRSFHSLPGGLVPRAGKKGECWTFLDWRLNSENDSPVHGQPSLRSLPSKNE